MAKGERESWIKMRTDLGDDPRVVRIMSACDADTIWTIGALHCVWAWFDLHSRDGTIEGVPPSEIDRRVGRAGFARAMEAVGWLVIGDNCLTIPDFGKHNGGGARRRAQESVRKVSARNADARPHEMRTDRGQAADNVRPQRERESKSQKERTAQPASATGELKSSAPLGGVGGGEEGNRHQASGIRGEADSCAQDSAGWLAGLSVREALRRLDVREPALSGLCSAQGITSEAIQAEWLEVCQVAVEQGLRNPTGVMLHRLAQKFHVELGASARLTREEQRTLAQLAKVRADFERVRSAGIERNGVHRRGAEAQRKAGVRA